MYTVAINFKNGSKLLFFAKSFDIDIAEAPTQGRILKYTYQDKDDQEAPLWLVPNEVAGIVVAPVTYDGRMSIATSDELGAKAS